MSNEQWSDYAVKAHGRKVYAVSSIWQRDKQIHKEETHNMRQEKIAGIIKSRQPLADKVESVQAHFRKVMDQFDGFRRLCSRKMQDSALADDMSRLGTILSGSDQLLEEGSELRDKLLRLTNRLSRDTLNIAVIGRARQGKSRLLQSITGLSSDEIPDGSLEFCTGVRSDIINDPKADTAYAVVHFLTEQRFLDEKVSLYFEELRRFKKDIAVPSSLSEFKSMSLPKIKDFTANHEDLPTIELHLKHLEELKSPECINQYMPLIGQTPKPIKKEEIREYVAQDDKQGRRVFFKHLAVDQVDIFCKFPNTDSGSLRVIDLPGLGDTHLGDVQRVARALKDQVDLIFFIRKPESLGAGWEDKDIQLYTEARRALGGDLPVSQWSFWVFNHVALPGSDNMNQCEQLRRNIQAMNIEVSDTVITDCSDPDDVAVNLIDKALAFLEENIERNDKVYAQNIQKAITSVMEKVNSVLKDVQSALRDDGEGDRDRWKFDDLFSDVWDIVQEGIQSFVDENSELRRDKDYDCEPFKKKVEDILSQEESKGLEELRITEQEVYKRRNRRGGPNSAYEESLNMLRTSLSQSIETELDETLNEVITSMKDKVCGFLGGNDGGKLAKYFGTDTHELADKVVEFITASGFDDDMRDILRGFRFLSNWRMSYRSFLQHRLRTCLNDLDPLDTEAMRAAGYPENSQEASEQLLGLYKQAVSKLRDAFEEMYPEPNRAAFAVAEEFKDIIIRSEGQGRKLDNQWKQLYWLIRGKVWDDVYGDSQHRREAFAEIRAHLQVLLPECEQSKFMFAY